MVRIGPARRVNRKTYRCDSHLCKYGCAAEHSRSCLHCARGRGLACNCHSAGWCGGGRRRRHVVKRLRMHISEAQVPPCPARKNALTFVSVTVVVATSRPRFSRRAVARRAFLSAMRAARSAGTRRMLSRRRADDLVVGDAEAVESAAA